MAKKSYRKASADELALMTEAMKRFHPDLVEAGVQVAVLLVEPPRDKDGEPTAPAITSHGVRCVANVKLRNAMDRLLSGHDAVIKVDAEAYHELGSEQTLAMFDHELEHLVVARDEEGAIVLHDDFRPKLELVHDDFVLTGFKAVIGRHGPNALESRSISQLVERLWPKHGQQLFPWMVERTERVHLAEQADKAEAAKESVLVEVVG